MTTDTNIRSYKCCWHKKWVDETKWNNQLASVAKMNDKVVGLQQWQALLQQVIYLYSITHFNTLLEFVCDWWAFKDFVDKITFLNASTVKWWETQDYDDFVFTYGHHWINEQSFEIISSPTTWIVDSPIFTIASLHNIYLLFDVIFSIYNENILISFPIFLFNASYWNYL